MCCVPGSFTCLHATTLAGALIVEYHSGNSRGCQYQLVWCQTLTAELCGCLLQVIKVKGSSGWSFEFSIKPTSGAGLFEKYDIVQDVQVS